MELAIQYCVCVYPRVRKSGNLVLKAVEKKIGNIFKEKRRKGALRVKGEKRRGNKRSREEVK